MENAKYYLEEAEMIYIPILKTRKEECNVLKNMSYYFSEKIIPMVEVIAEQYETKYIMDIITGEFIYEKRGKSRRRKKKTPTDDDIITLDNIAKIMGGKRVFIDYFRFSSEVYGNRVNIAKTELSWKISNNSDLYKTKLLEITKYPHMIPVVSIKENFGMSKNELKSLMEILKSKCGSIALRITEEWLKLYSDTIIEILGEQDYLLFDIAEQNSELKFMEIEEIKELPIKASIVLVNSPRRRDVKNGDYPEHGGTDLIINNAREVVLEYELDGYGDYCGLKDAMPLNDGSNGTGAALALFYLFSENKFYSYSNHDTSLGVMGYRALVPKILKDQIFLDPDNDCLGYAKVDEMPGFGNWATWNNINATRYIYQTYKYI